MPHLVRWLKVQAACCQACRAEFYLWGIQGRRKELILVSSFLVCTHMLWQEHVYRDIPTTITHALAHMHTHTYIHTHITIIKNKNTQIF